MSEVEVEDGLGHVDLVVIQTKIELDLLSDSVELLSVEVLTVKGKVPRKEAKVRSW